MPTINQLVRKPRVKQPNRTKSPVLEACPQKRGVCLMVKTMTPKKPNSALRKIARVRLSNGKEITAYIPVKGTTCRSTRLCLCVVVVCSRFAGVRYKIIRGVLDTLGVNNRKQARSRYGN